MFILAATALTSECMARSREATHIHFWVAEEVVVAE